MLSEIIDHKSEIEKLCIQLKVERLELFGSAAQGDFDFKRSDLDFLVEFRPLKSMDYFNRYFGLLEGLQGIFGREVDLVVARAIRNPYFLESVNRTRKTLNAA